MKNERMISQRDLRLRSREIMDDVEGGESFFVTRDGRSIGRLSPLASRPVFVRRERLIQQARRLEGLDADAFRRDLDDIIDPIAVDPYAG